MAWDAAKHPRDPRTGRFIKAGAALSALRGDSGTSTPAAKFPKAAAKRGGSTEQDFFPSGGALSRQMGAGRRPVSSGGLPPLRAAASDPATVRGIPIAQIADAVNADTTREAANARLEGLTAPQLRALAAHMGVPLRGKSKAQMRRDISAMGAGVVKAQFDVFREPGDLEPGGLMARMAARGVRISGTPLPDAGGGKVLKFPGAGVRRRGKARPRY